MLGNEHAGREEQQFLEADERGELGCLSERTGVEAARQHGAHGC